MKPRPIFPLFAISPRSPTAFATLQCHRNIHIRAIAPALRCQAWHGGSQSTVQTNTLGRTWEAQRIQHASTSTPAKKTNHGSTAAAQPPAKVTKTKVPAKPPLKPPAPVPSKAQLSTPPTIRAKEGVNPPSFTYPPEINVPARQPDQNVAKWLWNAGRAYVTFYKQGISNVRETAKLAKTLRQKAAQTPDSDMSEVLTRAEWQIVRRSKNDVRRLPIFGFLVLVLGEWLALVVVYLTPVIPEACRIPQQIERERQKRVQRRSRALSRVVQNATRLLRKERPPPMTPTPTSTPTSINSPPKQISTDKTPKLLALSKYKTANVHNLSLYEVSLFAAQNDCYPRLFLWLPFTPPKWILLRNLNRKFAYLNTDDGLIDRDGGWAALSRLELVRACEERSIDVLGKTEDQLRRYINGVGVGVARVKTPEL